MSYHIRDIKKGEIGKLSKIREELEEAEDAEEQGCRLMVLVELSDIIGAISCYLEDNHPSYSINDLIKMSEITERAFNSGVRE